MLGETRIDPLPDGPLHSKQYNKAEKGLDSPIKSGYLCVSSIPYLLSVNTVAAVFFSVEVAFAVVRLGRGGWGRRGMNCEPLRGISYEHEVTKKRKTENGGRCPVGLSCEAVFFRLFVLGGARTCGVKDAVWEVSAGKRIKTTHIKQLPVVCSSLVLQLVFLFLFAVCTC